MFGLPRNTTDSLYLKGVLKKAPFCEVEDDVLQWNRDLLGKHRDESLWQVAVYQG